MLKNKKINLLIFFITLFVASISSCGKLDYYEAPVYLNVIKTYCMDPGGNKHEGPDISVWYKPNKAWYPMVAYFQLETVSISEPVLDSMKPKGVTLNKVVMKYYPKTDVDLSGNPALTIVKYMSFFVPVSEEKEKAEKAGTFQKEEKKEEGKEGEGKERGVTYSLIVGDLVNNPGVDTDRLFVNVDPTSKVLTPKDLQYYWTLKCELYATDERGNQVKSEQYLYLNCRQLVYEEEK